VCNHVIGKNTFYKWRSKYGGLEHQVLKEIVEKKL